MLKVARKGKVFLFDDGALEYISDLKEEIEEKDKVIQGQQDLIDELWKRVKK